MNNQQNQVVVRLWTRRDEDRPGYFGHVAVQIPYHNFYRSCMPPRYGMHEGMNSNSTIITSYQGDLARLGNRHSDYQVVFNNLRIDDIIAHANNTRANVNYQSFSLTHNLCASENRDTQSAFDNYNCVQYVEMLLAAGGLDDLRPCHVGQVKASKVVVALLFGCILMNINTDPTRYGGGVIFFSSLLLMVLHFCKITLNTICGYGAVPLPEPFFRRVLQPASVRDANRNQVLPPKGLSFKSVKLASLIVLLTGIGYIALGIADSENLFIGKTASILIGAAFTVFGILCLRCSLNIQRRNGNIEQNQIVHRSHQRFSFGSMSQSNVDYSLNEIKFSQT